MKYYLIVYDRGRGKVIHFAEYEAGDSGRALADRCARELALREQRDIEVVVVDAMSRTDLERTHGRYFKTVGELLREGEKLARKP